MAGPNLHTVNHFAAIDGIATDDTSTTDIATDHSAIAVSHAVINLAEMHELLAVKVGQLAELIRVFEFESFMGCSRLTTESVVIAAELLL